MSGTMTVLIGTALMLTAVRGMGRAKGYLVCRIAV
jgi:hypothetical protein